MVDTGAKIAVSHFVVAFGGFEIIVVGARMMIVGLIMADRAFKMKAARFGIVDSVARTADVSFCEVRQVTKSLIAPSE